MSEKQSSTRLVGFLSEGKMAERNEAELSPVGGSMSPEEEMKLIEQLANAMPEEEFQPVPMVRKFSEVKEFDVDEWLAQAE